MSKHGFVDESAREGMYLICINLVAPARLTLLRKQLKSLLKPGQRELHFRQEKSQRRRVLIDQIARLNISTRLYVGSCGRKDEERTRQECLAQMVKDLLVDRAHRLVLDSRGSRDHADVETLQRALGDHPSRTELVYEHVESTNEPLLWISDAVAWCWGAGGDWRKKADSMIENVIRL